MKTTQELQEFIEKHWRSKHNLQFLIGEEYQGSTSFNFGTVPTEKVIVTLSEEGRIERIQTFSGLNWSAKGGYGSPFVDTANAEI